MNNFNVILSGVGGQGIITRVTVLDEACFVQGYDVKSSELHGLSQREGSVTTHIRFGKKINSPLVLQGKADLIIGLELVEPLRELVFSGPQTVFLVNDYSVGFHGYPARQDIIDGFHKVAKKDKFHLAQASDICQKELGKEVVATIYLLGYAVKNNLIPLKKESVLQAIKNIIPPKYLDLNIKAFELIYAN